jgi:alkylation response protein AidB-like acyl-CoA dehydrogenase
MAKLAENVIAPLNRSGDEQGCRLENGKVTTPKGFKEAYAQFIAGGWQGLSHPEEYGGQGMPMSMGLFKQEMLGGANWSFSMYPGLSIGAMNTLMLHATDRQKKTYLPPLTRALDGHDVPDGSAVRHRPRPDGDAGRAPADGSQLTGSKIFISSGDHDMTEHRCTSRSRACRARKGTGASPCSSCPSTCRPGTCRSVVQQRGVNAAIDTRWASRRPPLRDRFRGLKGSAPGR